jgi:predicted DNA-binding protein
MHKGRTVQFCAREAILDYIDEVEERFLAVDRISEEESVHGYDLLE